MSILLGKSSQKSSLEQATIRSIDTSKGRVGISLRNGLRTTASYLYKIADLKVGMNVVVGRVGGFYVIMNKVEPLTRADLSYGRMSSYGGSFGTTVPVVSVDVPAPAPPTPPTPTSYWSDNFDDYPDGYLSDARWYPVPEGLPEYIENLYILSGKAVCHNLHGVGVGICKAAFSGDFCISTKFFNDYEDYWWGDVNFGLYQSTSPFTLLAYIDFYSEFLPGVNNRVLAYTYPENLAYSEILPEAPYGRLRRVGSSLYVEYSTDNISWTTLLTTTETTSPLILLFDVDAYGAGLVIEEAGVEYFSVDSGEPEESSVHSDSTLSALAHIKYEEVP